MAALGDTWGLAATAPSDKQAPPITDRLGAIPTRTSGVALATTTEAESLYAETPPPYQNPTLSQGLSATRERRAR